MNPPLNGASVVPGSLEMLARMISSPSRGAVHDETEPRDATFGSTTMDRLELYRWAVQDPETHAVVLRTMYERLRPGRQPAILREDFAGTSAESVAWVMLQQLHFARTQELAAAMVYLIGGGVTLALVVVWLAGKRHSARTDALTRA